MSDHIEKVLKDKAGIRLDIGCGDHKTPTFVGMDSTKSKDVDIVHDLESFPWPLPDESVLTAVASNVLQQINPHGNVFINFMNEVWRVLKPEGQFAFVVPYAGGLAYWQDPKNCNGINEITMLYFDPEEAAGGLYAKYQPSPWKVEMTSFNVNGNLECVLSKREDLKKYHGQ